MLVWLLTAAAAAQSDGFDEAQYRRGIELYLANSCGSCHQLTAAETVGFFGPSHDAVGVIATARVQDPNYHGAAEEAAGYLRETLIDPQAYRVPGYALTPHHMPAYSVLDQADLDALVYLLLHQPPPAPPAPQDP
jgi:nitric oxide reductase subunit C